MIILGEKYPLAGFEKRIARRQVKRLSVIKTRGVEDEVIIAKLEKALQKNPQRIVVNLEQKPTNALTQYLTRLDLRGIRFYSFPHFSEKFLKKCFVPIEDEQLDFLEDVHHFSFLNRILKRSIDLCGAVCLLVLTAPLWPYAAWRVKKESPGPVFFKQERIGLNGRTFFCYKFRSMHCEGHFDPYTRKQDTRIFPWGQTMRRLRIDELPQVINVLKGEMSLIGPRTEWSILVEEYEKEIPYYNERHLVKPGITGWAQVNYPYGSGPKDARQKLMYDLYYIKKWNLWLELQIVAMTLFVVFKKKGL